ncbi:MAG: PDZ domain-containing protein [Planctomycetota bacterium]|nr:PDZ domain-containing protein [Planctomycetota bacterium]
MQKAVSILSLICTLFASAHLLRADDKTRSSEVTPAGSTLGELPRRGMFGARLAPMTGEVQKRQRLDTIDGVLLEQIIPDTSAADAEFKVGDVIRHIDGVQVTGVDSFIEKVAHARAGDVLVFDFVRDGTKLEKRVTLKEMPREKGEQYDLIYSHVTSRGARLRTIVVRPKTAGPHPAVFLLQGYGNFSIDHPAGPPTSFTCESFARLAVENTYVFDRHYSWLHQVVDRNMGEVWTKVASKPLEVEGRTPVYPRVLSIWGTSDWVSEQKQIAWIAEIVNRAQPGNGTFIALDSTDHFYFRAASLEESFRYFEPGRDGPFGEFNPVILETLRVWLDETTGIAKQK